ncbi:DNA cytosine methyltransferase [Paenibacillus polymyxa]|uniref:DNA cytosine methyltransferase n=1 Tax=Paenibacillus polymyxa TaxID=1406 RepID=UPI0032AF7050
MNHLSLFSGIGGIDLACHWAGMRTIAFCEREPFPRAVLAKQFPGIPIYDDVCTLTAARLKEDGLLGPDRTIDLISAGYPCQPFSNAGKRKGTEDDRHLWPEVARILREIRPRWFIGENVAGHISLGLDDVLAELESIGYTGQAFVIPSAAVGAPHRRDRVFVVAYTDSVGHSSQQGCGARSDGEKDSEQWEHLFCGPGNESDLVAYTDQQHEHDGGHRASTLRGERSESTNVQAGTSHVVHTTGEGLPQWRQSGFHATRAEAGAGMESESQRSGQNVADPASFRQQRSWELIQSIHKAANGNEQTSESLHDRIGTERATKPRLGGVSDGISVGLDKHRRAINNGFTDESRSDLVDTSIYSQGMKRSALSRSYRWSRSKFRNQFTRGGTTQSSMGRVLDGLSARLDQHQWPAGLGQPQHDWEPPRTAAGVKNRVGRLKALGNAVNPLQIYPVVAAISHIHSEHVRKGRRLPTTVKRTSAFRKRTMIKKIGENVNT